jgi:hypothetical protein
MLRLVRLNIEDTERPRRAKGELAHAVVDGPDGTQAVELSPVRDEALALKVLHEGSFWCSTQAGGCGGALVLAAGRIRVPYFRHVSGVDCALGGDSARAARSYEHLRYQRALLAWLEAQGLSATMEHHLGPDGRADLHVIVGCRRHTIRSSALAHRRQRLAAPRRRVPPASRSGHLALWTRRRDRGCGTTSRPGSCTAHTRRGTNGHSHRDRSIHRPHPSLEPPG